MASLAFSRENVTSQGRFTLLFAPTCPCSPQHRAYLLATKMGECPATDDPLGLFFVLLLCLTQLSDRSLRRRENLCQQFTEPLGLLLLQPPRDQIQVEHATHTLPVFEHEVVQTQALLDSLEKQLYLPSRSIQIDQILSAPHRFVR